MRTLVVGKEEKKSLWRKCKSLKNWKWQSRQRRLSGFFINANQFLSLSIFMTLARDKYRNIYEREQLDSL